MQMMVTYGDDTRAPEGEEPRNVGDVKDAKFNSMLSTLAFYTESFDFKDLFFSYRPLMMKCESVKNRFIIK